MSYSKTILVAIAWLICIIAICGDYDHETLFNYFANRVLAGTASLITLIVFFWDNSQYKREQDLKAFAATITAGVCVGVLLLTVWLLKRRDHSPTILFATAGKMHHKTIDLRKDKSFKITKSSLFEKEFIRGPYILKDSILILDSASVENTLEAHRFIARTVPYNDSIGKAERSGILAFLFGEQIPDTSARIYLIPIDARGTVIENARQFRISTKPPGD